MAKADNLLAILWLLRSRKRLTAAQLADALETSVRTIYRYVDALCASGVPIIADAGHDGGYTLAESFRHAPLFFEPMEVQAMFQAAHFARHAGYPYSDALDGGLTKLQRNLSPDQSSHLSRHTAALRVVPRPRGGPVEPWLEDLEQAVAGGATLVLSYQKADADAAEERMVDPYGLYYLAGLWYVVVFCHTRQALRDFRVDRIRALQCTGATFTRPADFSLDEHTSDRVQEQIAIGPFTAVRLRGKPGTITYLCEHWYLRQCEQQRTSPGDVTFRVGPHGLGELPSFLLPCGPDVEVLEPAALRQALVTLAQAWAQHHTNSPQLP